MAMSSNETDPKETKASLCDVDPNNKGEADYHRGPDADADRLVNSDKRTVEPRACVAAQDASHAATTEGVVYAHSSESMRELDDASVTLTVTSPPYFNAIDYDRYAQGKNGDPTEYRTREYARGFTPGDYESYLAMMQRVFREVYRVTKPGGWCVVVVSEVRHQGRCYAIPFDLTTRMQDLGWMLAEPIIWNKCVPVCDRSGGFVQLRTPGSYYPAPCHEHILVFRKPGKPLFTSKDSEPLPLTPLVQREIIFNVWHVLPVPARRIAHPCPFPEEIPHRLCLLYSIPGSLILDPFSGSGQTGKVALALGRRFVGYEIEPEFAALSRTRLREPISLRRVQVVRRVEHLEDDPFLRAGLIDSKERDAE